VKKLPVLLLLGALCLAQSGNRNGIDRSMFDPSCKPCDDFWRYATGATARALVLRAVRLRAVDLRAPALRTVRLAACRRLAPSRATVFSRPASRFSRSLIGSAFTSFCTAFARSPPAAAARRL